MGSRRPGSQVATRAKCREAVGESLDRLRVSHGFHDTTEVDKASRHGTMSGNSKRPIKTGRSGETVC